MTNREIEVIQENERRAYSRLTSTASSNQSQSASGDTASTSNKATILPDINALTEFTRDKELTEKL